MKIRKMKHENITIKGNYLIYLQRKVKEKIRQGWVLQGSIIYDKHTSMLKQAMIRLIQSEYIKINNH